MRGTILAAHSYSLSNWVNSLYSRSESSFRRYILARVENIMVIEPQTRCPAIESGQ